MKKVILILLMQSAAYAAWVSPVSHTQASEEYWFRCEMAYDNIDHTFAYEKDASARQPLELIFPNEINANMWSVSLWGQYGTMDSFELWLFYDDDWHLQWDGSAIIYTEGSIGINSNVSRAKVISEFPDHALCVLDVKLNHVPEPSTILLLAVGFLLLSVTKHRMALIQPSG